MLQVRCDLCVVHAYLVIGCWIRIWSQSYEQLGVPHVVILLLTFFHVNLLFLFSLHSFKIMVHKLKLLELYASETIEVHRVYCLTTEHWILWVRACMVFYPK